MKYVIRIVLLAVIIFLSWKIYRSIAEPVEYAKEVAQKEKAIIKKLKVIREAELAYKDVHGKFTSSFDTLENFMKNGNLEIVRAFGDKDDSTTVFRQEVVKVSVRDSLFKDVNIDRVRYLPGSDTLEFKLEAGVITKNNVEVPVFQATDPKPFSKERQRENNPLRVGSMFDVDYSGNWGKNL